jgi:ABC-type multidrug transport system fused ATPase/permease subunit
MNEIRAEDHTRPINADDNDRALVRMSNVSFRYQLGTPAVLKGLTCDIQRGSYCCLVGPSGSGKSTVLSILMGFRKHDTGEITVNGHDLLEEIATVSQQTAVVFQQVLILNGSIYDNIRYGCLSATREECLEAAKLARCDFIDLLDDGIDTLVGDSAKTSLSGGQMQRICLARGLVRRPQLLLLDEATSALDGETEASIINTLEELVSTLSMTIVSVTHRLSTCVNADQILVLNHGCVQETGTYAELRDQGGLFAVMVDSAQQAEK